MEDTDPDATKGTLCSTTYYRFNKIEGLTAKVVQGERAVLNQMNKEQLKKDAQDLNVKVNCWINGASHNAFFWLC